MVNSIYIDPWFLMGSMLFISLVFCVVFLFLLVSVPCLVYPMLSLSLDCQFLIALRFSLTFISNLIIFLIVNILVLQQRSVDTIEHKRIYLPRKIWTCLLYRTSPAFCRRLFLIHDLSPSL